ncbi:S-adenosyl-L-methionine-dependent methyltransferase [Annulohypoxylon maeteangense]|uniref:S-adenosyl-L-methionine-dependent methyltransferase n=1 Tax=Annulohypoxylon maeteangense TaxID=1927788 RepID=UPI0020075444|nr:S-adenosyl-L-methionine-dependent methyltransferase [Annulohypoxylon maeteangense]KAI0890392.1 S-adenosyl-L-methionine-dependent methyltransferase [Annulohypoxylon maeteangense]
MATGENPGPATAVAPTTTSPEPTDPTNLPPGATEGPIEADPQEEEEEEFDDADSALGDGDNASSTASLTESILEYRTLNGRTFHSSRLGSDNYWGPNDERQNEAMDMNHHFMTLCLGGRLFMSPLKPGIQKVLDVGTGTGLWAIDFADEFPDCEVIGTDLSPIQPSWCPPNVKFEIDDAQQPWTFAPSSFDFIHLRYIVGGIADWTALFKQAYTALKPGGWIESFEPEADYRSDDGTLKPDSNFHIWRDLFSEGGKKLGVSFTLITDNTLPKALEEAGFVNITVRDIKVPVSGWPADPKLKEIGQWFQYTLEQDLEGYVMFMWTKVLGRTLEEMHVFLAGFRREMRNKSIHVYLPQRLVYAQKPETA